jgi:hypothetical protein
MKSTVHVFRFFIGIVFSFAAISLQAQAQTLVQPRVQTVSPVPMSLEFAPVDLSRATIQKVEIVEGAPANVDASYYDKFLYQITGDCKDPKTVWFYSSASWIEANLGKVDVNDPSSKDLEAAAHIQLFPDGTFWARYIEVSFTPIDANSKSYKVHHIQFLEGKWTVDGNRIVIPGLGDGVPAKLKLSSGYIADGIAFVFRNAIHDSRAVGKTTMVAKVGTNLGPRGLSIKDFCHLP